MERKIRGDNYIERINEVLKSYPIGSTKSIKKAGGTANLNWIIQTGNGRFFLKCRRPEYSAKNRILFESAFQRHLADGNLPAFPPLKTKRGKGSVILDSRVYQLYPFIEGNTFCQDRVEQLIEIANVLSQFHLQATSFSPPVAKDLPRYDDPRIMGQKLKEVSKTARGENKEKISSLFSLIQKMKKELSDDLYWSLPATYIHGDFHPVNLKFKHDKVVGIFDFDWASLQPRLRDIADGILFFSSIKKEDYQSEDITSLTQWITFDQKRTKLFLSYYERQIKLSPPEKRLLPYFIKARWLNCRIDGMRKVPEEKKVPFLLNNIFLPLNSLKNII